MLQFFKAVTAMSTGIFLLSVCTRLLPASVQEQHLSHAVPAAQNAAVLSSYFTGSAYQAPLFSMPAAESPASTETSISAASTTAETTCTISTTQMQTTPSKPESSPASVSVPKEIDTWFKAYMDYRTITDTSSPQYAMQQNAWTDANGLRRTGDDYLVAMGTGWLTEGCGDRFQVTLDSGSCFTVTVGDIKADCHTDATRRYRPCAEGANVLEFIVDTPALSAAARTAGTVSVYPELSGNITDIQACS